MTLSKNKFKSVLSHKLGFYQLVIFTCVDVLCISVRNLKF